MNQDLIFIYGSLRSDVPHSRHDLVQPAERVGGAVCGGRLYYVEGYPGAVPGEAAESKVQGEVYRLLDGAAALERMDRYEGYDPKDFPGSEFYRVAKEVVMEDGSLLEVWVYYYNRPVDRLEWIPDGDYVRFMKERLNGGKGPGARRDVGGDASSTGS